MMRKAINKRPKMLKKEGAIKKSPIFNSLE